MIRSIRTGPRDAMIDPPVVNRELLGRLARRIEAGPWQYDQRAPWSGVCGTPCCVAGHAYQMATEKRPRRHLGAWGRQQAVAQERLGLTHAEANRLFASTWPEWWREAAAGKPVTKPDSIGVWYPGEDDAEDVARILEWIAAEGRIPEYADCRAEACA